MPPASKASIASEWMNVDTVAGKVEAGEINRHSLVCRGNIFFLHVEKKNINHTVKEAVRARAQERGSSCKGDYGCRGLCSFFPRDDRN